VDTLGLEQTRIETGESEKQAAETKAEEQYHRGVDRRMIFWGGFTAITTGLLVLVGIGGTLAAVRTIKAIEKQVQSQIDADRAWLMVEARFDPTLGVALHTGGISAEIELVISNAGPTPAWVYEQYVYLVALPQVITSLNKYPSPQFPYLDENASGHANYEIHPMAQGDPPKTWKAWVSYEGHPSTQNGPYPYVIGVVRYRDAFSALRETYFGYSVESFKRMSRIPNEAYNKHT
jgi:hypothetical protein